MHEDDIITPVERPPLPENVPYIKVVGQLVLQLAALNSNLSSAVHEMRVAREPVEKTSLGAKLRGAFSTLKEIAVSGESAFSTETNGVTK